MRDNKRRYAETKLNLVVGQEVHRLRRTPRGVHCSEASVNEELTPPSLRFVSAPKGLPKTQKVGGQTWEIHYSPDLLHTRNLFGITVGPHRTIVVDTSVSAAEVKDTLFHEILHACLYVNDSFKVSDAPVTEEVIVRSFCPVLIDWMRSNKRWW